MHRYIGSYVQEFHEGDKIVMRAPGEFIELSKADLKDPTTKRLVSEGLLIEVKES